MVKGLKLLLEEYLKLLSGLGKELKLIARSRLHRNTSPLDIIMFLFEFVITILISILGIFIYLYYAGVLIKNKIKGKKNG